MIIKNTNDRPVEIEMATRVLVIHTGEEKRITADEVRDPKLRENLQVRAVSIVRPSTEEEEAAFILELEQQRRQEEECDI